MSTSAKPRKTPHTGNKRVPVGKPMVPPRRAKRNNDQFYIYIHRVLKQVHPDSGINTSAIEMIDRFCIDILLMVCARVQRLIQLDDRQTVSSREVQTAVKSLLPGELAKHAISEGTKSVTKFSSSKSVTRGPNAAATRKEKKAGLVFPVGRIENMMRENIKARIGENAPVYLASVIEYLCAELLELSGNSARDNKRVRVARRDIYLAIMNDQEFLDLVEDNKMTLPGGVVPRIHAAMLPTKPKKAAK